MALKSTSSKLLYLNNQLCVRRQVRRYVNPDRTSKAIRQRYLDYFINENNHAFVRSSPVVPFCDPTVPFVNAGMNQFKGILLGTAPCNYRQVANVQKCVRIGGKHNDINAVGTDGYHHTFFEMLGNWTFGECDKAEMCRLCWNLLTEVYRISPSRLYVTYFKGDEKLNIKPDEESRDVWESLGVPPDRILPFGMNDNFWEMGVTGPCGPCTEIHIDRLGSVNRAKFVNKNLPDLVELWNIVFIQFNRNPDGTIEPLSKEHIDTGMGLERLTAVLQGKISNYDTDLFTSLFSAIERICPGIPKYEGKFGEKDWNSLDASYRIMADHSRMITVCLADGVLPEHNTHKLKRIMRKVFQISEANFKRQSGLLKELTNYVVEQLGPVYPELERNIYQIHQIIDFEEEVYNNLKQSAAKEWQALAKENPKLLDFDVIEKPGLIAAYKEIQKSNIKEITPEFSYKLYDTFGLDEDTICSLSQGLSLRFDPQVFRSELQKARARSKAGHTIDSRILHKLDLYPTEDSFKYDYARNDKGDYDFPPLEVKIWAIFKDNGFVTQIGPNITCELILNRTNFYTEAGGQTCDTGIIKLSNGFFEVSEVRKVKDSVLHKGIYKGEGVLKLKDLGSAEIDGLRRYSLMQNHTAVHLLNSALKTSKRVTCQKSSYVGEEYLSFDVGVFGKKLTIGDLKAIEDCVHDAIDEGIEVNVTMLDSQMLYAMNDITLVPGEVYPDAGIRLIEIVGKDGFVSREPCCGTHVHNTADLEDFYITSFKSLGRSTTSLKAVTGEQAKLANQNGLDLIEEVTNLQKKVDDNIDKPEVLNAAISELKKKIKGDIVIPVIVKSQCLSNLACIEKQVEEIAKGTFKEFIELEMQNVLETKKSFTKNKQQYIIHYLRCSMILENVPLHKATKICPDLPILVIAYSDGMVKARCCVPEKLISKNFNAEKWLEESVSKIFGSKVMAGKGQDPTLICNMRPKKVNLQEWDTLLKDSLALAKEFIEKYL